jgi:signal transduction histidine kinase
MKIVKKIQGYLQANILAVFVVFLFLSFAMVGIVFNFVANHYISSGAIYALSQAKNRIDRIDTTYKPNIFIRALRGSHRFQYTNVRFFETDENFIPLDYPLSAEALFISQELSENHNNVFFTEGMRIRANYNVFYVSILTGGGGATVFYLDVSDTILFTSVINRLLIASVAMIWLVSMIIASALAESAMKPLKVLRDFVMQLGHGDFTPNSHVFVNEKFDELNQCLNTAARQLAEHDNQLKTFFQNVSHELRTPLMHIKSYAEAIEHEIYDSKSAAATIILSADKLKSMVDDILYVSRLDTTTDPAMEEADLNALVETRVKLAALHAEKHIEIEFISANEPEIVNCAAAYIERALDNLIGNACRFAKTKVTVEFYAVGVNAIVRVSDDGPGFEPDALPYVFERFYKGKNGLTGIGLSIVHAVIVDRHKGFATAENGEKGAVLTISIPRKCEKR